MCTNVPISHKQTNLLWFIVYVSTVKTVGELDKQSKHFGRAKTAVHLVMDTGTVWQLCLVFCVHVTVDLTIINSATIL